jgi:chitinase
MRLAAATLLAAIALGPPAAAGPLAFAPYFYVADSLDLAGWARESGGRDLILAFYNSDAGGCRGAWPADEAKLLEEVGKLRAMGGDVILSSGGWNADDLAERCTTPEALADAYDGVLTRFAADHLDLDPEPGDVHDNLKPEIVDRRAAAVAILQKRFKARGRSLKVSFTIAVRPAFGFDAANLNVLQSALAHGVEIDAVNPMIMDYRDGTGAGEMGRRSVMALEKAHGQLAALYPGRKRDGLWRMMATTPMLGQNDAEAELFTLDDAKLIADFAKQHRFRRLAFWSTARDNGSCPGQSKAQPRCSGLKQNDFAFSRIFARAMTSAR